MQALTNRVKVTGKLVSTTDTAMALKLGRIVNLKSIVNSRQSTYEYDGDHLIVVAGSELYELV